MTIEKTHSQVGVGDLRMFLKRALIFLGFLKSGLGLGHFDQKICENEAFANTFAFFGV
jgi:hypothetical protein